MTPRTFLVLGRVSNLPTVWTNALAGLALSAAATLMGVGEIALLLVALSLFYVGGMYLNDAFDAEIDAAERSARPIPTGQIGRGTVFVLGFAFIGVGIGLSFLFGQAAGLAGIGLAAAVTLYDWLHKKSALGPVIMGACRLLTYVVAALAAGALPDVVLIAAFGLLAHTAGLTYAAKQEAYDRVGSLWPLVVMAVPAMIATWMVWNALVPTFTGWICLALYLAWTLFGLMRFVRRAPGDVPKGVVSLIAGMALYDAVMLASVGAVGGAVVAVFLFGLTLALQRVVPGT